MASFDGLTLQILGMEQPSELSVQISDRPIPGSTGGTSLWYRDIGPVLPETFEYKVRCDTYSDLAAIKAKAGVPGVLIDYDATRTATLESVSRPQRLPSGIQFVSLRFREG
jgi:hypothetical protein